MCSGSFAPPPRKVQSTAPRRAAHLEHTTTPRTAFYSVRAAVRSIFRQLSTHRTAVLVALLVGDLQNLASRRTSASCWFMWDGGLVRPCSYRRFPCDLPEIKIIGGPCRLTRRAALKGIRVILTRAGARGLGITTRKAAEGTRAHFCAGQDYYFCSCSDPPTFCTASLPLSSDQVRQARLF